MTEIEREVIAAACACFPQSDFKTFWAAMDRLERAVEAYEARAGVSAEDVAVKVEMERYR